MFFGLFNKLLSRHAPAQLEVDGGRLQSIGKQIWIADRELQFVGGLRLPVRMVVIGNESGELLCYSPIALDDATVEALAGIGEVHWIVAPNPHHTLFVAQCQQLYPRAQVLTVAPLGEGAPMQHGGFLVARGEAMIGGCFEALVVQPRDDFRELVIYHDLSETLLVADLMFNVRAGSRSLQLAMRANGAWRRTGHTRLQRILIMRDRQALADFYRWALARPFVQITMSHGQVISHDAREVLYQAFHRYLQPPRNRPG